MHQIGRSRSRRRMPCRQGEYHDESTRQCLEKCGENLQLQCSISEYCDTKENKCKNKCSGLCEPPKHYCDHDMHHCMSCNDTCTSWKESSDCRIYCPDVYRLKSTTLDIATTVPATTAAEPTTSNNYTQTALAVGIALPLTCIVFGIVIGLICWKIRLKETRSPVQDGTNSISNGDHPNNVEDTTRLNLLPLVTVTHTSEQTSEERKTFVSQKQSPALGANATVRQPISVPHSKTGQPVTNKQLPAPIQKQPTPTSGPHTKYDMPKPLSDVRADNSNSSATGGNNSLVFDSGSSYGISLSGIPDNLLYREGSPISPAMAAAAAAAQLNQHPRIDYEEQIRKIKAMNWGSISNLDLREDAALSPCGDLFRDPLFDPPPAELKLSTPTPSMQARIDERVRIIEILDKLDYVVYHMFSRDNVTVVIRPSDITFGEARRQLIELGIPEEDFTLENFRYDSTETDSESADPSHNLRSIVMQPPANGHESLAPENGPITADSGLDLYPATGTD